MKRIGNALAYAVLLAILIAIYLVFSFGNDTMATGMQSQNLGAYFNGKEYIQINHTVNGNFTAVLWVKYANANSLGVMVASGIGENEHSAWYVGDGGEVANKTACGVFSDQKIGSYTAGWRFATIPQLPPNAWYQIACVYNLTSVSLYVDGNLVNSTPTPYAATNASIMQIGKRTSTFYLNSTQPTFAYFTGSMANIQVYRRALSEGSIFALYKEGMGGVPLANASIYVPLAHANMTPGSSVQYYVNGSLSEAVVKSA
ncbi:MAG: LamG domain-containing protein [Candidatus Micrarchaeia archaeon]